MKSNHIAILIVVVLLFVGGIIVWKSAPATVSVSAVTFSCDQGKTIQASFYPQSVSLKLSDGRTMSLPQAVSASGARYANADETFVFWNKGNTAFITENAQNIETYSNCVASTTTGPEEIWNTFASSTLGFSLQYPPSYTVDQTYQYNLLGPANPKIKGVKFSIPKSMATGSNLSSSDTGISIEWIPGLTRCTASAFFGQKVVPQTIKDDGTSYSVASTSDAGAGNFYDETVYALDGSNPCQAFRYFIHSTNINNYEPGAVQEFDRAALLEQFDRIRRSLTVQSN